MNVSTEQRFTAARSHNSCHDEPLSDTTLHQLHDLLKWGPTSANCSPACFVFARTPEAKARLLACVSPGNASKVREAPVTAVIGMDLAFCDKLPQMFPHTDARAWFVGHEHKIADTAMRNSSLQGGTSFWRRVCSAWTAAR